MGRRGKSKRCEIYVLVLLFLKFLKKRKMANCTVNWRLDPWKLFHFDF